MSSLLVAQQIPLMYLTTPCLLKQNWIHYLILFLVASRFNLGMMVFQIQILLLNAQYLRKKVKQGWISLCFSLSIILFSQKWTSKIKMNVRDSSPWMSHDVFGSGVMMCLVATALSFCIIYPLLPSPLFFFILQLLSKI